MSQWRWPQPVLLKPIENGPLPVRVWNPKLYKGDSFHLMPIITPAYPSMCATFNITRSSMKIIQRELKRALDLSENIMIGKNPWSDLFVKHTFFTAGFKYYISVISASKTKENHKIWSGYVESKVRMLVQKLEQHPSIALARPFNKGYERQHLCKNDSEVDQVQEGSLEFLVANDSADQPKVELDTGMDGHVNIKAEAVLDGHVKSEHGADVKPSENSSLTEIFTTTHYIGLELNSGAKSLDLSYEVDDFKTLCTQWQKYQDSLKDFVSIGVQHVRNFNLPDDVFEPNEKKPQKKSGSKKRPPSEENPPPTAKRQQQTSVAAAG